MPRDPNYGVGETGDGPDGSIKDNVIEALKLLPDGTIIVGLIPGKTIHFFKKGPVNMLDMTECAAFACEVNKAVMDKYAQILDRTLESASKELIERAAGESD